ncbi:hypothetical protein R3P38DRAFT_3193631 [Favolaschia claudopus]|uniref:Uncharacterized protein n=1 Tax=Favolaschia claudopus TaxID=2862362 RepID=A0AAW0BEB1_9AGAR
MADGHSPLPYSSIPAAPQPSVRGRTPNKHRRRLLYGIPDDTPSTPLFDEASTVRSQHHHPDILHTDDHQQENDVEYRNLRTLFIPRMTPHLVLVVILSLTHPLHLTPPRPHSASSSSTSSTTLLGLILILILLDPHHHHRSRVFPSPHSFPSSPSPSPAFSRTPASFRFSPGGKQDTRAVSDTTARGPRVILKPDARRTINSVGGVLSPSGCFELHETRLLVIQLLPGPSPLDPHMHNILHPLPPPLCLSLPPPPPPPSPRLAFPSSSPADPASPPIPARRALLLSPAFLPLASSPPPREPAHASPSKRKSMAKTMPARAQGNGRHGPQ